MTASFSLNSETIRRIEIVQAKSGRGKSSIVQEALNGYLDRWESADRKIAAIKKRGTTIRKGNRI